jgi:hypothetical protein
MAPGKINVPDRIKKFVTASAGELQAIYEATTSNRRYETGAASVTVDALMHSLRRRGELALAEPACQQRLSELSLEQIEQVITRLTKMRRRYPAINDDLIARLNEHKVKRDQPPEDGWQSPTEIPDRRQWKTKP